MVFGVQGILKIILGTVFLILLLIRLYIPTGLNKVQIILSVEPTSGHEDRLPDQSETAS